MMQSMIDVKFHVARGAVGTIYKYHRRSNRTPGVCICTVKCSNEVTIESGQNVYDSVVRRGTTKNFIIERKREETQMIYAQICKPGSAGQERCKQLLRDNLVRLAREMAIGLARDSDEEDNSSDNEERCDRLLSDNLVRLAREMAIGLARDSDDEDDSGDDEDDSGDDEDDSGDDEDDSGDDEDDSSDTEDRDVDLYDREAVLDALDSAKDAFVNASGSNNPHDGVRAWDRVVALRVWVVYQNRVRASLRDIEIDLFTGSVASAALI